MALNAVDLSIVLHRLRRLAPSYNRSQLFRIGFTATLSRNGGTAVYRACALFTNIQCPDHDLRFNNFRMWNIESPGDLDRARKQLGLYEGNIGDFVYEREYSSLPKFGLRAPYGFIPMDVDDALFLFRLFRVGDIALLQQTIIDPWGGILRRYPHRIMSEVSTVHHFVFSAPDVPTWDRFAEDLLHCQPWTTRWFSTARRYFLFGSSKEFNIPEEEVDRVLDYMLALEAVLVPEKDVHIGARLRHRGTQLLKMDEIQGKEARRLLGEFYGIRSTIVHGDALSSRQLTILERDMQEFETIVRSIIQAALYQLSDDDIYRKSLLKSFYDVTNAERVEELQRIFSTLSTESEKKSAVEQLRLNIKDL